MSSNRSITIVFLMCFGPWMFLPVAAAQMVKNDSIGNDPAKEQLCALRVQKTLGSSTIVPFFVDSGYVKRARQSHSDATFIAVDGMSPQLVECFLRRGTGRFEPDNFGGEQWYWHLIKPRQFEPSIATREGRDAAARVCLDAATKLIHRSGLDHSVNIAVAEINLGGPLYHPGIAIGVKKAQRYDVAVRGTSFYRSKGPDLAAVNFTCLLSPMLELKAIQLK